jgi:uncharacterized surface protein with fasciclin (FAS1) repeats
MNRSSIRRTSAAGAALVALSLGLAACGDDADGDASASADTGSSAPVEPTEEASDDPGTEDAGAETFGDGCAAIPTEGKGSFNGMVTDPVATAASNNPLLKTLVTAVGEAGLADTLNSAPALTVFAPTDDAFAKLPEGAVNELMSPENRDELDALLRHHVVEGERLASNAIPQRIEPMEGGELTARMSGGQLLLSGGDDQSARVVGDLPADNGVIHAIDSVLMTKDVREFLDGQQRG